jgi:hypothetical protein
MPRLNTQKLIGVHVLVASFFLPMALLFAITGGLYTLGIKGAYDEVKHEVPLSTPLEPSLPALLTVASEAMAKHGVAEPSGKAGLRKAGQSFELEWTGVDRDVLLRPTADAQRAELVVKNTTLGRRFVQLHKAKGSEVARAFSVAWAVGLLVLLGSGMAMAFGVKHYRRRAVIASGLGIVAFVVYAVVG